MIRAAVAADVADLVELESACFGVSAWTEDLIGQEIAAEHRAVLVEDDLRAYGAISVLGDVADLDRIAVAPSARRRGLAGAVLADLIGEAREQGATRILLEVAGDNAAAIGLYEAFQFIEISRRLGYYPGGIDALIMELNIQEVR